MALCTILTILFGAFTMRALGDFSQLNELNSSFGSYYSYQWGSDHFSVNRQGTEVQLKIDESSGAGFRSKLEYQFGLFHIRMKIPKEKTEGIITSFYLTSAPDNENPENHFEFDYEFLGTKGILQTNVFDYDNGNREQRFKLWFDPSKHFHTYGFLWNSYQIVFIVDEIPIRVFKNNMRRGMTFSTKAMHIVASLWSAPWAGVVEWSKAPFVAHFSDFSFQACPAEGKNTSRCASNKYFWNSESYRELNATQKQLMRYYRSKYMFYDYCSKESTKKKECLLNA